MFLPIITLGLVILQECCYSFNFDTDFIDIIKIGGDDNSYFGYSVLLQKGNTISSVLVGAPKSNSTYANHTSLKEPGVMYKCDIGNNEPCKPFVVDLEGNTEHKPGDSRFNYKNRRDGALLGATIDGGENVGDPVFVCAPRWVNDRFDKNGQHYLANGMCYSLQNSNNTGASAHTIMPLLNAAKQGYSLNTVKYYYALGQAGMSIHYLKNGKSSELLLGAPGVLSWKGTPILYRTLQLNVSPPQQRLSEFREKRQIYNDVKIPNPVYISSLIEENVYFGYAVSSGRFHSRYPDILWYVAGAPRAEELLGAVLIYEYAFNDDDDLILHKKLVGHQLGSYFGAALLCTDINGDSADEIFVGAPTCLTEHWDEGCVYVYKNNGEGSLDTYISLFGDKKPGARFGTAISNLGDINGDLYNDIAIAAPSENGHGAVYIYLGSTNGINQEYVQKISAGSIDLTLHGFGFSISKGLDIDQNLSNDIAIGAYKSGHVAILKSKPVIKYHAKFESNIQELAVNTTTFNVTYFIGYTSSTGTVNSAETKLQIVKDSRALNKNNFEKTVTLVKTLNFTDTISLTLMKSETIDYSKPFTVELFYNRIEVPVQEFCANCPVTDPFESKSVILTIPFANGCGSDNICQPNLKITANFQNNLESLTIGTLTTLNLYVDVENNGEPAYLSKVMMVLPPNVEILRISSKCELNDDRLYQCLLDNVLQTNTTKALVIELDVKNLNPKESNLHFNLTVESKGEEINPVDNMCIVDLPLELRSDINIAGKSNPDQIIYTNKENELRFKTTNLTHNFVIQNFGPSPLFDYTVDFYLPIGVISATVFQQLFEIYKPEVNVNNQPMNCSTDAGNDFATSVTTGKDIDIDEGDLGSSTRRLKRSTELQSQNIINELPVDSVFFINCTDNKIRCMHITCTSEDLLGQYQYITASFPVQANIYNLNKIMDTKRIMLFGSRVEITKNNDQIIMHSVQTLLLAYQISQPVPYWICILCVVAAVIILAVIVFGLHKLNFFNRPVREKLQNEYENASSVGDEESENVNSRL